MKRAKKKKSKWTKKSWDAEVKRRIQARMRRILTPSVSGVITPIVARDSVRLLGDSLSIMAHITYDCFDKIDMVAMPEPVKEIFLKSLSELREAVVDAQEKQKDMLGVLNSIAKTVEDKYENERIG